MSGLLFILAHKANRKLINRVLLYVRDWEYGNSPHWDSFRLVTSQNEIPDDTKPSVPPIKEFKNDLNEWEGRSYAELEEFMVEQMKIKGTERQRGANLTVFLALDDQGIDEQTITLIQRNSSYENNEFSWTDSFSKVRMPWDEAYISWCNLDIANMDFESFCDEEKGPDEDGWWTYEPIPPHPDDKVAANHQKSADDAAEKRDAAVAECEKSGDV